MAEFDFCIDAAFKAGKITKALAEEIKAADNPEVSIDNIVSDLTRQKREAAIQAVVISKAWDDINSHKTKGKNKRYNGLIALLTKDPTGRAGYDNVEYLAKTYTAEFHADFAEAMSRFRTRRIGFSQDEEGLRKLIKAIYGEKVDDSEIMGFGEDWLKVTEKIRNTVNSLGGSISKNEKWLMPQSHDPRSILNLGKVKSDINVKQAFNMKDIDVNLARKRWKEITIPRLDRSQMLDDIGRPLSDEEFDEGMNAAFDSITTYGLSKMDDFSSVPNISAKLSRKGSEKRFLFFKDADSWIEYQKDFGKGDIFTTLTDHLDAKGNDAALLKVLGPNPDSTFKALKGQIEKETGMTGRQKAFSETLFNVVSGKLNRGDLVTTADFMESTRNVIVASTLGGAFLSALSDVAYQGITTRYNNIPAIKTFKRQLELMDPSNEEDRLFSVKMGLMAEAWTGRANASNRFSDTFGTGATAKISEGVMRASLLSPWTDAGRKAFGMEFSSMLAENFSKAADDLDPRLLRSFDSYGITKADWDLFRVSKPLDHKGVKFADMLQPGSRKFHQMIMSETDFAVPTPDAKVRAITTGGLGRATVAGQLWRSFSMFKSFPITLMTTHFYRAAYQATNTERVGYMGGLMAASTVMGGVAVMAKDFAAGREPRPIGTDASLEENKKFLEAAWLQGGGLGIFGDFMFSDVNRFGSGFLSTAAGPVPDLVNDIGGLTIGNVQQAYRGEETNVLGEATKFAKRYTPDIWQTRLLSDSMFDQIELMADPKAQRRFNRVVRKRQKEYNQNYWWKPGDFPPKF